MEAITMVEIECAISRMEYSKDCIELALLHGLYLQYGLTVQDWPEVVLERFAHTILQLGC